ncbi:MAG: hypothetical protein KJ737_13920 [Proteobacteria bacterium]|nr:hypothetical protein [Pseudomonadota bacterium]
MSFTDKAGKKNSHLKFDKKTEDLILKAVKDGKLSCAKCFSLSDELDISAREIGQFADTHHIRLVKCQLGLFGTGPGQQKGVLKINPVPEELKKRVFNHLDDGKLDCKIAWKVALEMNITKMNVSGACETLGVRIKNCQIGAF